MGGVFCQSEIPFIGNDLKNRRINVVSTSSTPTQESLHSNSSTDEYKYFSTEQKQENLCEIGSLLDDFEKPFMQNHDAESWASTISINPEWKEFLKPTDTLKTPPLYNFKKKKKRWKNWVDNRKISTKKENVCR